MGGNDEEKRRGRPKSNDPKVKFDNVRLKSSTMFDIKMISDELGINENVLVQTILENEMPKYKKLLNLEDN